MYFTYIAASRSHNFYVGITSDIEGERFATQERRL
jgi:predicted GIY-YIG superfamily endonuclease